MLSPTPFFFCSFPHLPYPLHPFYLPSIFIQFLSLPLSHFATYINSTCSQLSLSPHSTFSAPSFLFFQPIPVFSLLLLTFKSGYYFSSLALSIPRCSRISSSIQLSYFLLYVDFFILSLLSCFLCVCPFHSALHSSIFFLLLIVPLLHCPFL
jgi:hypothetical protein